MRGHRRAQANREIDQFGLIRLAVNGNEAEVTTWFDKKKADRTGTAKALPISLDDLCFPLLEE